MITRPRAKADIWVFLALLLLFSGFFYAIVFLVPDGAKRWGSYTLVFMWCPALAAIATKLVRDRSLRGLGWGWGRTRYLSIAYGVAVATCLLPYLVIWVWLGAFNGSALAAGQTNLGLPSGPLGTLGLLPLVLVVSPLIGLIGALGEEIGWRGFLVPRMHSLMGFTRTSLVVGLIWAAWHYPINMAVFPLYRPQVSLWYANGCFTLLVVGASFMHTWLRMRSESLWPSALGHAAGNAFQGSLQALTLETSVTSYLTTEYGASFAVVGCLLAFLFWRKRHEVEPTRTPLEAGAA
jgi:membrane protease YdiL (CAAX protease family)